MENKDFWDRLLKGSDQPSDDSGKIPADMSLDSGGKIEDKPTTFDPPQERKLDIEAILADIHRQAVARAYNTTDAASVSKEKQDTTATNRSVTSPNTIPPAPSSNASPGDTPEDEQNAILEMTAAMRELTEELRYFRTQMSAQPTQTSALPSNAANPDDIDPGEPLDDSSREHFLGSALDGYGNSEPEDKNIRSVSETVPAESDDRKKTNKALSIISNILFYVVIVAMVLGAFLMRSTSKGQPFMLGGVSAANVLTSSMEDVYPRGSLIITKTVDPSELKIGDDITFMVSEDTSITHRIIKISKDPVSGDYMFTTKGTNNQKADENPVSQANVVGKVIFSSKLLGDIANFIKSNWPLLLFVLIVIIGLISFLKWNAKKSYGDEQEDEEDGKEKKPKVKKEKPTSHIKKRLKSDERMPAANEHEQT